MGRKLHAGPLTVTAAIAFGGMSGRQLTFLGREEHLRNRLAYSFASFNAREGDAAIVRMCEWLDGYIERHAAADMGEPFIICDFDDARKWFDRQIVAPLSGMQAGLYASRTLSAAVAGNKARIFLSYRSTDAGGNIDAHVGRVFEFLKYQSDVDGIFWDKRSLRSGTVWSDALREGIRNASAIIAFIGPEWEQTSAATASADADSVDWVHNELRWALEFRCPILPVMVGGRRLNAVRFPFDLAALTRLQSCDLDHVEFDRFKSELLTFLRSLRVAD
jgi:hypothetical protein